MFTRDHAHEVVVSGSTLWGVLAVEPFEHLRHRHGSISFFRGGREGLWKEEILRESAGEEADFDMFCAE